MNYHNLIPFSMFFFHTGDVRFRGEVRVRSSKLHFSNIRTFLRFLN